MVSDGPPVLTSIAALCLFLTANAAADAPSKKGYDAMVDPEQSLQVPPVYTMLKDLHLTTELVREGEPNATIVVPAEGAYGEQADRIQEALADLSGIRVPMATDDSPSGAVPFPGNLIVLGNRSTNRTVSRLYDLHYALLDLRYPGPGGHVVRTVHNPFGDGRNVILVGGSDPDGMSSATTAFIETLAEAEVEQGRLALGRLMEIRLSEGIRVPEDVREFETWEASVGYGSVGYFGWNLLSKRMAMYYMTGDEHHAREFLRLAFPDGRAKEEISEIDGERIENKDDPLAGPYHYNTHMMILYWDLIEESPVFSDEDRLRITNAFARQLVHPEEWRSRKRIVEELREGPAAYVKPISRVGSRHEQWSAIALYCLARYFQRDYPAPLWAQCVDAAKWRFSALHQHTWVVGELDYLPWYCTSIAPIYTYLALTGDREPWESGVAQELLRAQEILVTGNTPDWALHSASIGYLNKAAYLTGDGRWIEYRNRTGIDLSVFRLGQSFWPDDSLRPGPPDDLVGKWCINPLPEPMWRERNTGFPLDESFLFGSFRSASDASGDFILIDGYNAAYRNPYHSFAIPELRIDGHTLLKGMRNQVLTRADGLIEPKVAMEAALRCRDVLGNAATVVAEVPDAAYCNWRRSLVQRIGQYTVFVDQLTFRTDSDNIEVRTKWERPGATWDPQENRILLPPDAAPAVASPSAFEIRPSDPVNGSTEDDTVTLEWFGEARDGQELTFFSLIGRTPASGDEPLACVRVAQNAAALGLPSPALVVSGTHEGVSADLAIVACDHLHARGLCRVGIPDLLAECETPIDVDWDFAQGRLHVVASGDTRLGLRLSVDQVVTVDGDPTHRATGGHGLTFVSLSEGRHVLEGAYPDGAWLSGVSVYLKDQLEGGLQTRHEPPTPQAATGASLPEPVETFRASLGGEVVALLDIPAEGGSLICAAEGRTVHVLDLDGREVRRLEVDGNIRVLHWWSEHGLLLVGCDDEQVWAFDAEGRQQWQFLSEMAPELIRAAKTYWFKTDPRHGGIFGLYSAVFLDGRSQAFVGSATTLEILDENGHLVKRLPTFWGDPWRFAVVGVPDGSLNLLVARRYNLHQNLNIINNRTLYADRSSSPRGFHKVPEGHAYMSGSEYRYFFHEDLDGDGAREVIAAMDGRWNRLTVWSEDDRALYNAHFGPGHELRARHIHGCDIADLDGDGKKEIVVAIDGLVLVLDCRCHKLWAMRPHSRPTALLACGARDTTASRIAVGCENGTLLVLDGRGHPLSAGQIDGAPVLIHRLDTAQGPVVVAASSRGELVGFRP